MKKPPAWKLAAVRAYRSRRRGVEAVRVFHSLSRSGLTLADAATASDAELLRIPGIGQASLALIRSAESPKPKQAA